MWQDRLVAKLLQEVAQGPASPWHPYLQALPRSVPSALDTFNAHEAEQVQLPSAVAAIKGHAAKMQASHASCRPDAIGGADLAAYRWAHTVIMSRSFGCASPEGGVGVRFLVPLIDMLNHGGDEAPGGLLAGGAPARHTDVVRWDVVHTPLGGTRDGSSQGSSGSNDGAGVWQMVLSATAPIAAGDPLLLSYREGTNDEFLLAYGFIPPANPHDTLVLFPSLSAALEATWAIDLSQVCTLQRLAAAARTEVLPRCCCPAAAATLLLPSTPLSTHHY